jgi:hypothetical protein
LESAVTRRGTVEPVDAVVAWIGRKTSTLRIAAVSTGRRAAVAVEALVATRGRSLENASSNWTRWRSLEIVSIEGDRAPLVDETRGRRRSLGAASASVSRSLESGAGKASPSRGAAAGAAVDASAASSSSTTASAAEGGRNKRVGSNAVVETTRSKNASNAVGSGKNTGAVAAAVAVAAAAKEGAEEGRIEVTGCYHDELVF